MRICLVTETFPPEINGVSMTLGRLVNCLADKGEDISVVTPSRQNRLNQENLSFSMILVPGLPIPKYPELRFGLPSRNRLVREWKSKSPEIVHIATEGPLGWSALRAAARMKIPVVSSFHTNFHSYTRHYGFGPLNRLVLHWLKYIHNRSLLTFVPSEDIRQILDQAGFENLKILSRGVDLKLFGPHRRNPALRKSWGAQPSSPVALYVGRLASEKNIDLVIAAFTRMQSLRPDTKLVLVGDGPIRHIIERNFPEIHFAGMRKDVDLAEHYASADCFIFASTTETFGNVVTEAMASGLPVLAYDYAATAQFVVDGTHGMTVPVDDREAFLSRAVDMITQINRWKEMGEAARKTLIPQSWVSVAAQYLHELKSLKKRINPYQDEDA